MLCKARNNSYLLLNNILIIFTKEQLSSFFINSSETWHRIIFCVCGPYKSFILSIVICHLSLEPLIEMLNVISFLLKFTWNSVSTQNTEYRLSRFYYGSRHQYNKTEHQLSLPYLWEKKSCCLKSICVLLLEVRLGYSS